MSDDWDFYQCRVDDQPASIMVDLGIRPATPMPAYPDFVWLRVYLRTPTPEGLTTNAEANILHDIEDSLTAAFAKLGDAIYVARDTTGGFRAFACYATQGALCENAIRAMMEEYPEYRFDTGYRLDPDWSVYRDFLYPSPRLMQTISNRKVCDALVSNGDHLDVVREVDHWIYFLSAEKRAAFLENSRPLGFQLRAMHDPASTSDKYGVQLFRSDSPERIDEAVLQLYDMAQALGGEYDGWETQVQA
jgi:hypothetical protein